jgi:hypothetical protein
LHSSLSVLLDGFHPKSVEQKGSQKSFYKEKCANIVDEVPLYEGYPFEVVDELEIQHQSKYHNRPDYCHVSERAEGIRLMNVPSIPSQAPPAELMMTLPTLHMVASTIFLDENSAFRARLFKH